MEGQDEFRLWGPRHASPTCSLRAPSPKPQGWSQGRQGLLAHRGKEAELTTSTAVGGLLFLVRGSALTLGPTSHKTITEMR